MTITQPSPAGALSSCCTPLTAGAVDEASAEQLARVFKALGDPTRVRLVSLIAATEDNEACICDLTEPVGLSQPTVSHHMKILAAAGLVRREQRGRWAYFSIDARTLEILSRLLATSPAPSPSRAPGDCSAPSGATDDASGS